MKILYLANSGTIFGGGQISLLNLLQTLDKKKFNPLVVCPSEGNLVSEISKLCIPVAVIPMLTLRKLRIVKFIKSITALLYFIRDNNIDLIHTNGSRCTIYGGIAAKLVRIPLLWHVRIADKDPLLDKFLCLLSTKIIVTSKAVGRKFDLCKENKVVLIPNGVDTKRFNPEIDAQHIREQFEVSNEEFLIGTIAQLIPWKGHKTLLYAANEVIKKIPNTKFLIVGEEVKETKGYKDELQEITKHLKIEKNVLFTGFRRDTPEILSSLDLFVLPSKKEHFGRVIIEAMACAKPVIATNAGGVPEIVKDGITGILVPPGDAKALACAILSLLQNNEKVRRMGIAGRKRVEEEFSLESHTCQIQNLYNETLCV